MEGSRAIVLGIVRGYKIRHPHDQFKEFLDKEITIIHMYLPDIDWDKHREEEREQ